MMLNNILNLFTCVDEVQSLECHGHLLVMVFLCFTTRMFLNRSTSHWVFKSLPVCVDHDLVDLRGHAVMEVGDPVPVTPARRVYWLN